MRKSVIWLGVVFLFCAPALSWAADLKVTKAVVCSAIKDGQPVGEGKEFPVASTKKVFFYNVIEGASQPAQIAHVWYFAGKKVHEFSVPVKAAKWRTWTSKNIFPGQTGAWKVDVVDTSNKKVIGSAQFQIK